MADGGPLFKRLSSKIILRYTGEVEWYSPVIVSTECKVDVQHFPFDDQQCSLEFGSWTYSGAKIDIHLQLPYVDDENYSENQEWLLYDSKAEKRIRKYNCCPDTYPTLVFTLFIKRRAMFFLCNLIIPCGLITAVSLFSFILPPNSGERVSFVITVLLALTVYMMIVTEKLPQSAQMSLASKFFLCLMVQLGLSLVATCFIIRLHNNDSPLPKWFDVLVNHYLARVLCMPGKKNSEALSDGKDEIDIKRTFFFKNKGFLNEVDTNINTPKQIHDNETQEHRSGKEDLVHGLAHTETEKTQKEFDKLSTELNVLADKLRETNKRESVQSDWIFATSVLDRCYFNLRYTCSQKRCPFTKFKIVE
ncbi:hypothetical protein QZH41_005191 [Actinostola sp. cb2023]|nr:hypothetical protein QZH41_005191 [Actinostola sp. cb2023]